MTHIKNFDKKNLPMMRRELVKAVSAMEKKYGVRVSFGNFRYDSNSFTSKMEVYVADTNAPSSDGRLLKFKNNVEKHGWKLGVSLEDLGKVAQIGKWGMCEFIGCKDRDSRAPLVFQAEDGSLINAAKTFLPR